MHQIPNAMSIIRMVLVLPLGYLIWHEAWAWVFWIFVGAGLSDLLDGALARHFGWESEIGGYIDPLADKVLCGGIIVVLALQQFIPWWISLLVVSRELVILGGAGVYRILYDKVEMQPLTISKFNTGFLIAVLILLLAKLAEVPIISLLAQHVLEPWAYIILAGLVVISGVAYVVIWSRKARRAWLSKQIAQSKGVNT